MIPNPLTRKRSFKSKSDSPLSGLAGLRALLIGLLFVVLSSLILVLPVPLTGGREQLRAGDVAQRDVRAPERITYVSQIQTENARNRAEASVPKIYDPPDTHVARRQVARVREIFDYLESVRADNHASPYEKRQLILAVDDLTLSDSVLEILLTADSETWSEIRNAVARA